MGHLPVKVAFADTMLAARILIAAVLLPVVTGEDALMEQWLLVQT